MVAEISAGLGEHHAGQDRRQRRQRIFAGARRLERIAAFDDLALQIAGLAGDRCGVFELVVIRLELVDDLDRRVPGKLVVGEASLNQPQCKRLGHGK